MQSFESKDQGLMLCFYWSKPKITDGIKHSWCSFGSYCYQTVLPHSAQATQFSLCPQKREQNALVGSFVGYSQEILPAGFRLFIWSLSQTPIYLKSNQEYLTNNNPVYYSKTSFQHGKEELPFTNETSDNQTTHISKSLQIRWV